MTKTLSVSSQKFAGSMPFAPQLVVPRSFSSMNSSTLDAAVVRDHLVMVTWQTHQRIGDPDIAAVPLDHQRPAVA
ncbi:hypothetical protein [Rhodococcus sp. JVH1]|uniref:hypothetical protein n=1 Tax=Rhodococcus sp. JVH1 TaxID=745408 RepID=UPI003525519A